MEISKFREIPLETDFQYLATDCGRIFRFTGSDFVEIKGWLEKSRYNNNKYYRRVSLKMNGVYKKLYTHRIICFTFHGEPNVFDVARHLDDNSLDNRAVNLAWGTFQDNADDRVRNNTTSDGTEKKDKIGEVITSPSVDIEYTDPPF